MNTRRAAALGFIALCGITACAQLLGYDGVDVVEGGDDAAMETATSSDATIDAGPDVTSMTDADAGPMCPGSAGMRDAGSIDPLFGDGGVIEITTGPAVFPVLSALDARGRITIAVSVFNASIETRFLVLNVLPDGRLDPDFAPDAAPDLAPTGVVRIPYNPSAGYGVARNSGGRVVATGFDSPLFNVSDGSAGLLVGLNEAGAIDTNFGTGGVDRVPLDGGSVVFGPVAINAGMIHVGGSHAIFSDGGFADGGTNVLLGRAKHTGFELRIVELPTPSGLVVASIAFDARGRTILFGGAFGSPGTYLVRFETDGGPDPTFGEGGVMLDRSTWTGPPAAMARQPTGGFVVVGREVVDGGGTAFGVARYDEDGGTVDPAFADAGASGIRVVTQAGDSLAKAIYIDGNGKITIAGHIVDNGGTTRLVLVRLTPSGLLDPTFGNGGIAMTGLAVDPTALTYDPCFGRLVVVGIAGASGDSRTAIVPVWP